jgi:hypothetical protein
LAANETSLELKRHSRRAPKARPADSIRLSTSSPSLQSAVAVEVAPKIFEAVHDRHEAAAGQLDVGQVGAVVGGGVVVRGRRRRAEEHLRLRVLARLAVGAVLADVDLHAPASEVRDHLGRLDLDAAPRAEGEARVVGVHGVSEGELDIADGRRASTGEDRIVLRADDAQLEVVVEAPRLHDRRHEEDEQLGAE